MSQGVVRSLVLRALSAESRHGSGIIAEIGTISGGHVQLRAGALFLALYRLRVARLITIDREEFAGHRLHRYYRLTPAGRERLMALTSTSRRHLRETPTNQRRFK